MRDRGHFPTPQSARREDGRQSPGRAKREERPDEEERPALRHVHPPVDDGHARGHESAEEHDDAPRSPLGQHERPIQQDDQDQDADEALPPPRIDPSNDVVRHVNREEEGGEQGGGRQQDVVFHAVSMECPC
jgi:hypothetical protein